MSGFTEVPVKDIPSFCSLTHLVELDLSKNMLQELPEAFGNLTNLKRLDLYGNKLTHLPLSFCHLKSLRWLDLKNNPLVPMLAEIAGPCGDMQQCQQCARNVVATLTQTAIKVEEDRKKLLQEKLKEQEQIEQEYLIKKKELDSENLKKAKKKAKKNKTEKQTQDLIEKTKQELSSEESAQIATEKKGAKENKVLASSSKSCLQLFLRSIFFCFGIVITLCISCVLFAAYDRKSFLQLTERYDYVSNDVTGPILYVAKYVENASKHPTLRELRSQLGLVAGRIQNSTIRYFHEELPVLFGCHTSAKRIMDPMVSRETIQQAIVTHNLQVKALIQDISHVSGPMDLLNEMNAEGREKLAKLRKYIDQYEWIVRETDDTVAKQQLSKEVESHRQQYTSSLAAFRHANISAMLRIEKAAKTELLNYSETNDAVEDPGVRHRKDKVGLAKMSTNVTDQLLSISRNLADTTQRSAETLETLANSSTSVHSTKDELRTTSSVIQQSGTLLAKYGRRELTDKVLLFFAFAFFFACVLYIVHKRLF
ncbi:Vesicle transport protein SEC20 [Frankliniella fusca]|uniref:Vesicle transport protein SEC20 n=1 Tax=Frankliniella fusca TaxID=407009 RepID=A0AAE1LID6_9NEOP|nr:Vesicle transport protein SEC20 [Frankliniella fusca]